MKKRTEPATDRNGGKAVSFEDFWQIYLRAHRKVETRIVHYCAAACGVLGVAVGVMTANFWGIAIFAILSYGLGAGGHVWFEKNRILVQNRPLWSLACCYRMALSALTGHLVEDMNHALHK